MKKIIISSIRIIFILCILIWLLSLIITLNGYKDQIQELFKKNYDVHIELRKDIKISLLPLPHIKIPNIDIYNNDNKIIYTGDVSLYIYPQVIISDDIANYIYQINISNSKIDIKEFADLFKKNQQNSHQNFFPDLVLSNISINTFECSGCIEIDYFSFHTIHNYADSRYDFRADLLFNGIDYKIRAKAIQNQKKKNEDSIDITIYNDYFQSNLKSVGTVQYENFDAKGKSNIQIKNLKKFFDNLMHSTMNSQYHKKVSDIFNEISLTISTDFTLTKNSFILENIAISDTEITDFTGNVDASIDEGNLNIYCTMQAHKINLDAFIEQNQFISSNISEIITTVLNFTDTHNYLNSGINNQKVSSYIDINISNIRLLKQNISNTELKLDLIDSAPYISKAKFEFPGGGILNFNGYYSQNRFRPKINGNLFISIKNLKDTANWLTQNTNNNIDGVFLFQSDVVRVPHSLRFDNIKAALDSTLAFGNMILSQDAIKNTNVRYSMHFNQLNLDNMNIDKQFNDLIKIMHDSDSDKSRRTYLKAVDNYKWLRYINYNINADITAEKVIVQNTALEKFFASIELSPGIFSLNNISFASDNMNLKESDVELIVSGFRPQINASLNFDNLSFNTDKPMINKLYSDELDQSTVNFFSLYNFDGDIKLGIKKLSLNQELLFNNVTTKFSLLDGVISLIDSKANAFNGELKAVFSATPAESLPQFRFGFSLNNINPGPIFKIITGTNDMLSGYLSAKGSFHSLGTNWGSVFNRLNGSIDVIGKKINWNGFDLEKMIESNNLNLNIKDKLYTANYYSSYGSTIFDDMNANILVRGPIVNIKQCGLSTTRVSGALAADYNLKDTMTKVIAKYVFIPSTSQHSSSSGSSPIDIEFSGNGFLEKMQRKWDLEKLNSLISNTSSITVN